MIFTFDIRSGNIPTEKHPTLILGRKMILKNIGTEEQIAYYIEIGCNKSHRTIPNVDNPILYLRRERAIITEILFTFGTLTQICETSQSFAKTACLG